MATFVYDISDFTPTLSKRGFSELIGIYKKIGNNVRCKSRKKNVKIKIK